MQMTCFCMGEQMKKMAEKSKLPLQGLQEAAAFNRILVLETPEAILLL